MQLPIPKISLLQSVLFANPKLIIWLLGFFKLLSPALYKNWSLPRRASSERIFLATATQQPNKHLSSTCQITAFRSMLHYSDLAYFLASDVKIWPLNRCMPDGERKIAGRGGAWGHVVEMGTTNMILAWWLPWSGRLEFSSMRHVTIGVMISIGFVPRNMTWKSIHVTSLTFLWTRMTCV